MTIHYTIDLARRCEHYFVVKLALQSISTGILEFRMPAWIPGSYMIRDYARNVVELNAFVDGNSVISRKSDKQTWEIEVSPGTVTIEYVVYAYDTSVRGAHIDVNHAYFNGVCIFLVPSNYEDDECILDIKTDTIPPSWSVAIALTGPEGNDSGVYRYRADNYSELIDSPCEIAEQAWCEFEVGSVKHRVAISGKFSSNLQRLSSDLAKICTVQSSYFEHGIPCDQYLFIVYATKSGYGGLEHCDSTSLICPRRDLYNLDDNNVSKEYRRFLGLCSHEYFHLWNVKRIKPAVFVGVDLDKEKYTSLLWWFEGVTSYYDDLALVRSGCISKSDYLDIVAQSITRLFRTPGRKLQSIAESSFDAWTRFYKQDENAVNAIVSYYTKGALVSFALDMHIRELTDDRQTLDDLLAAVWETYGLTQTGVPERGIQIVAEKVINADLSDFFQRFIFGTEDPDFEVLFAGVGVQLNLTARNTPKDEGGFRDSFSNIETINCEFGMVCKFEDGFLTCKSVITNGAAQKAGLSPGDRIIALDKLQADLDLYEFLCSNGTPGQTVNVDFFKDDLLCTVELELEAPELNTCVLSLIDNADQTALERLNAWLYRNGQ